MARSLKTLLATLLAASTAVACSSQSGDSPRPYAPNPLGAGKRIAQVTNPTLPDHPANGASVNLSGVVFTWLDTFDETKNGKSLGTVYIQDVASQAPFAGISIYEPAYIPPDLRLSPGDVLDYTGGQYGELPNIGTATFTAGTYLVQLSKPVGTFDYEYTEPAPVVIDPNDLTTFNTGLQWTSMLVTIKDVYLGAFVDDGKGRVTAPIETSLDGGVLGVQVSNELIEIDTTAFAPNTHFSSVTGLVTWFFNYHIAPRSLADLVVAP